MKRLIYKSIVDAIVAYRTVVGSTYKTNRYISRALELGYWERCCNSTRLNMIRNEEIRRRARVGVDNTESIDVKPLKWFGYPHIISETNKMIQENMGMDSHNKNTKG